LKNEEIVGLRNVTRSRFWLAAGITTFEARDRMAPVAAWLTQGISPDEFGPEVKSYTRLKIKEPVRTKHEIAGEILYIDKFGNLMTNISLSMLRALRGSILVPKMVFYLGKTRIDRFVTSYSEVKDNRPYFLVNSQGLIEIAVNKGSASAALGAKPGNSVKIRLAP
jgi:S-adenosylmethionine hydrolase